MNKFIFETLPNSALMKSEQVLELLSHKQIKNTNLQ